MRTSELADSRVGVLGMGAEGRAILAALRRAGHRGDILAFDDKPGAPIDGVRWAGVESLGEIDVLARSPGFPPHHPVLQAAAARGLPLVTATNLFLAEARAAGLPVVGITGSKGKSTTSTLAFRTLQAAGVPSVLVGNIGVPALEKLPEILDQRLATVFELSSYQCHDLAQAPDIAVLLDLFPEHMNWHGSIDAYYGAKLNIAARQAPRDRFLYNASCRSWPGWPARPGPGDARMINHPGDLHFADGWFYRKDQRLFSDEGVRLKGLHNRRNAVSALAAAELLGARPEHLQAALADFRGLPHRLEDVGEHGGIRWINDAISTAPEAGAAAVEAVGAAAATLIAGGQDRGYDFAPLAAILQSSSIDAVILLPDSGAKLAAALAGGRHRVVEVPDLTAAVAAAAALTPRGRTCLFSPSSPSYNQFRDFQERGERFRALVQALGLSTPSALETPC